MEYYELSATSFADKIQVGRSSISHIISGRNKPSLDFVMKVVQTFPEVELYWFLNGKGSFPPTPSSEISSVKEKTTVSPVSEEKEIPKKDHKNTSKAIEKVIVFYTDGTFDAYNS
ncbi:helix-turn-helix transcriptional regulator [Mesonia sp. MT50]|uniref:Helix-turn-helix transcriptional regulator n=2 Tax=Mesonia profundi TaxID=3070998 RepID=A0ABU1A4P8_9FLAO|nr:helix-turn-helix transcriptional regulator [Mesonia profundi]MDQ7917681.1 helix-turn-helix transcriptional regulator [Mesonia profundi]